MILINQKDFLLQRKDEILSLLRARLSSVLIYERLRLGDFNVSLNSLDAFLKDLPEKKNIDLSHKVRSYRASIKGAVKPGDRFHDWELLEFLGYQLKDSNEFVPKRTKEAKSTCFWKAKCHGCQEEYNVSISNLVKGRSKGCTNCKRGKFGKVEFG
jgi:hypothetical protein